MYCDKKLILYTVVVLIYCKMSSEGSKYYVSYANNLLVYVYTFKSGTTLQYAFQNQIRANLNSPAPAIFKQKPNENGKKYT